MTTSVCEREEFSTDTSTPSSSPPPTHEQRIQRLLALTQPVVSDITFLKEGSTTAGEALSEQYRVALHNAEMEMEKQVSSRPQIKTKQCCAQNTISNLSLLFPLLLFSPVPEFSPPKPSPPASKPATNPSK